MIKILAIFKADKTQDFNQNYSGKDYSNANNHTLLIQSYGDEKYKSVLDCTYSNHKY